MKDNFKNEREKIVAEKDAKIESVQLELRSIQQK